MKKKGLIAAFLLALFAVSAYAQPRAIGGRIGYGIDVSYQHSLGSSNMVEVDVDLPGFAGIGAAATYDWIFPITSWQERGSWNWYAGVGAGAGWWWSTGNAYVGVAGRIGVEYNFWFPLNLSLDWRPILGPSFGNETGFYTGGLYAGGIALGVRYLF